MGVESGWVTKDVYVHVHVHAHDCNILQTE